ncbi:hypothetical protein [Cohnella sp. GCM10012308]
MQTKSCRIRSVCPLPDEITACRGRRISIVWANEDSTAGARTDKRGILT